MSGFQVQVFDISLEKDVYREGEHVIGLLTVVNEEELKIKSLRLDVCGVAVVHWDGVGMEMEVDPVEKMKGDHSREVFFSKNITLIHKEGGLLDKQLSVLTSGSHQYPFEVKLPQELPSSFEGKLGKIRYLAKATIHRPKKTCIITRKVFSVVSGLDLNFIPEAGVKIELCKQKELGSLCCNKGSVTADWCVNSSGFVPGEDIRISGAIQNESQETVSCSKVTLLQVIDYHSHKRHKQQKRPVVTVDRGETEPSEVTVWQEKLHIPPLPPTALGRCKLLDVNYELQFTACFEGKINPIMFYKDIYIGTVPICYRDMKSCVAGMFNQPYHESAEFIDADTMQIYQNQQMEEQAPCVPPATSTISLTRIIQAVCKTEPKTNPSAPRLDSRENLNTSLQRLCTSENVQTTESRPPPYAPGHNGDWETEQNHGHNSETLPLMSNSTTSPASKNPTLMNFDPSAPGPTTILRNEGIVTASSLYPTLSASWINDATNNGSSSAFTPIYPYYSPIPATNGGTDKNSAVDNEKIHDNSNTTDNDKLIDNTVENDKSNDNNGITDNDKSVDNDNTADNDRSSCDSDNLLTDDISISNRPSKLAVLSQDSLSTENSDHIAENSSENYDNNQTTDTVKSEDKDGANSNETALDTGSSTSVQPSTLTQDDDLTPPPLPSPESHIPSCTVIHPAVNSQLETPPISPAYAQALAKAAAQAQAATLVEA